MEYIPKDKVVWQDTKIIKLNTDGPAETHPYKYQFALPYPLSDWDVFDYWEKERFASMEKHLKQGDVLFDIGTEQGWCNLIYAQFCGAENMVLIEPTPEFWPNIKQIWEKNGMAQPKGFYDGLFSDKTTDDLKKLNATDWPADSEGDMIDRNSYKYIHEHGDVIPQVTIDDYVATTNIVPNALTMDTEGSELLILRGAEKTLKRYHPKVWVSVHPDLGERDYGIKKEDTLAFMEKLGYQSEYLATDHEEHWYFSWPN